MFVALVDIAGDQLAPDVWVGQAAFAATDPPAPDECVPRGLIYIVFG